MNKANVPILGSKTRRAGLIAAVGVAAAYSALCVTLIFHKQADRIERPLPSEWTKTRIGQISPRFRIITTNGKIFDSSVPRKEPLLLTFFATWCGPCGRELMRLEPEVWQRHKGKLTLIAISIDDGDAAIKRFWHKRGFTFPAASDAGRKAFPKFATAAIPRTYLISSKGRIIYQSLGYSAEEFLRLAQAVDAEISRVR